MKKLAIILAAAALTGCATYPPGPPNYAARTPVAPGEWEVVSVTPVPLGTGARAAAAGETGIVTSTVIETPAPVPQTVYVPRPVYAPAPVYGPAPVYAPAPVYVPPPTYWYPPVSIGLGFSFGKSWNGHGHRWRGHHGGHRGGGHRRHR